MLVLKIRLQKYDNWWAKRCGEAQRRASFHQPEPRIVVLGVWRAAVPRLDHPCHIGISNYLSKIIGADFGHRPAERRPAATEKINVSSSVIFHGEVVKAFPTYSNAYPELAR